MKLLFKNFISLSEEEKTLIHSERNKPVIRSKMYNQEIISIENHLNWINNLKNKIDCLYFLVLVNNEAVGVVDFTNITHTSCESGSYLFEQYLGSGYGIVLEKLSIDYIFNNLGLSQLNIAVLESNKNVFKNHCKYFGFKKNEKLNCLKENNLFLGFSLSKDTWNNLDKKFINKCISLFDIDEVIWSK